LPSRSLSEGWFINNVPTVGLPQGGMIQFLNCLMRQLKASASNIETRSPPLGSTASFAVPRLRDRSSHSLR
jgi:hypothetical protein